MAVRYIIRNKGQEKWSELLSLRKATKRAAERVGKRSAPYLVYEKDHQGATQVLRWKIGLAKKQLKARLKASPPENNETWRLESEPEGFYVAVRKVQTTPLADEPSIGTAALKVWHQEVFGAVKGLVSWGIYACRVISGSTTMSQHSYANAEDAHGTAAQMQAAWDYTYKHRERLKVAHMIYNHKIWSSDRASEGVRPFTGSNPHTDHLHCDFNPQRSGPCKVNDE